MHVSLHSTNKVFDRRMTEKNAKPVTKAVLVAPNASGVEPVTAWTVNITSVCQ